MNLQYLFEIQAGLDAHIEEEHPKRYGEDRISKKILALQVELGELANEWRGFKFWSKDQEPRTYSSCKNCTGQGLGYFSGKQYTGYKEVCLLCDGTGKDDSKNPLLEEYVDCLHFILSIGLEIGFDIDEWEIEVWQEDNPILQFIVLNHITYEVFEKQNDHYIPDLLSNFLGLGVMLGFTEEQIEEAYLEKNKINHKRQVNGY